MRTHRGVFGGPELLIVIGSGLFISVLGLSAYFEADIRWLHFFQAWMYLATIALSLRHNRWGYFIGISAAGFWNYINLFVTTFSAMDSTGWVHQSRLGKFSTWTRSSQCRLGSETLSSSWAASGHTEGWPRETGTI